MKTLRNKENLTYLALWGLLFIIPVLSLYLRANTDPMLSFSWGEVFAVWRELALFFAIFLLHNFLLAPLLIYRQRRWAYFTLAAAIVVMFALWQCSNRPEMRHHPMHTEQGPPPPATHHPSPNTQHPSPNTQHPSPNTQHPTPDSQHPTPPGKRPPVLMGEHDIVATIILVLMLGMNLGVKLYFKNRDDQLQMAALEKQNLEQQLEYLRYQINPHFFMNTLNNIHALVDIDPEQAKSTIRELSKMMRFVLYEGNKKTVPLSSELSFLRNYITLMGLRYTDKVDITLQLPETIESGEVPPLLFVTFVENAFKHGISYQQQSFIEIQGSINDGKFAFHCRNSKRVESGERREKSGEKTGGVGLRNVRQRLDLIYGSRYSLNISDGTTDYNVELTIPIKS